MSTQGKLSNLQGEEAHTHKDKEPHTNNKMKERNSEAEEESYIIMY